MGFGKKVALVLLIIGAVLMFDGYNSRNNLNNARNINDLYASELETGMYVTGNIKDYLLRTKDSSGNSVSTGVTYTDVINGTQEKNAFAIKTRDNKYIQIFISDQDVYEELKSADFIKHLGNQPGIYVEGKIVNNTYEIQTEFFKSALKLRTDADVEKRVCTTLIIEQCNLSGRTARFDQGMMAIGAAILVLFVGMLSSGSRKKTAKELMKNPARR